MQPVIKQTENYALFELHEFNRDIRNIERLLKSMRKYGFIPHKAISCVKNGAGKLIINDGHHRFVAAKTLGMPIWYILADDPGITIQEEQFTTRPWNMHDYLNSYFQQGAREYIELKKYIDETGIPIGLAISILSGESAGSNNKRTAFKTGRFKLGDGLHARQISAVVSAMKAQRLDFAANSLFIQALSKMLWVEDFDVDRFISKIKSHAALFEKQPTLEKYLSEIEKIYNRQSKTSKPLAFMALAKARERHANFGKE